MSNNANILVNFLVKLLVNRITSRRRHILKLRREADRIDMVARSFAGKVMAPKWISFGGAILTAIGGAMSLASGGAADPSLIVISALWTAAAGSCYIILQKRKREAENEIKGYFRCLFEKDVETLKDFNYALQIMLDLCSSKDQNDILFLPIAFPGIGHEATFGSVATWEIFAALALTPIVSYFSSSRWLKTVVGNVADNCNNNSEGVVGMVDDIVEEVPGDLDGVAKPLIQRKAKLFGKATKDMSKELLKEEIRVAALAGKEEGLKTIKNIRGGLPVAVGVVSAFFWDGMELIDAIKQPEVRSKMGEELRRIADELEEALNMHQIDFFFEDFLPQKVL